jgi:outer membrane protein assembly factor BamD (BamD/ComL family)
LPEVEHLYAEATRAYQAKDFGRAVSLYGRVIAL